MGLDGSHNRGPRPFVATNGSFSPMRRSQRVRCLDDGDLTAFAPREAADNRVLQTADYGRCGKVTRKIHRD